MTLYLLDMPQITKWQVIRFVQIDFAKWEEQKRNMSEDHRPEYKWRLIWPDREADGPKWMGWSSRTATE
jgi:hypothetical protein